MSKNTKIPKEVWSVGTEIIKDLISPFTAITKGIARLIEQKFSTLNEVQKIYAEQTIREAIDKTKKINTNNFTNVVIKPEVIYIVLDNTDSQSNDSMRDLWSNLAARELAEGSVHPEIARVFSKLTAPDIMILSELYSKESSFTLSILKALASAYTLGILGDKKSFNHIFLQENGLIERESGKWFCTIKGKELIRSISTIETK